MSIYVKHGVQGQIQTTHLPSGDMAVAGPTTGPLEQVMFDVCRWDGRRNPSYGGWIIPSSKIGKVRRMLEHLCQRIAD